MANLKAGTATDFSDSMAKAIYDAMQAEWLRVKGKPLSQEDPGAEDRRILFAAIAQGVLRYLHDHEVDIKTSQSLGGDLHDHKHRLDFGLTIGSGS